MELEPVLEAVLDLEDLASSKEDIALLAFVVVAVAATVGAFARVLGTVNKAGHTVNHTNGLDGVGTDASVVQADDY